jgi:hypothetical protein
MFAISFEGIFGQEADRLFVGIAVFFGLFNGRYNSLDFTAHGWIWVWSKTAVSTSGARTIKDSASA